MTILQQIRALGLSITCVIAAQVPANELDIGDVEERYNQIYSATIEIIEAGDSTAKLNSSIAGMYTDLFSPIFSESISDLTDDDLNFLARAADLAIFYTKTASYLSDLRAVMSELESRGVITNEERLYYFRALISYRLFNEARNYRAEFPDFGGEAIPEIADKRDSDESGPLVYKVAADSFRLDPEHRDISTGVLLIVVSHPLCGFSRRAMKDLASEDKFSSLLQERTLWLTPVGNRIHFNAIQRWNTENPIAQIVLSHAISDWPMIETWDTPTFYLVQDGELLGSFSGWPKEGNRESLLDLLAQSEVEVKRNWSLQSVVD
jgi:hypothetical protein